MASVRQKKNSRFWFACITLANGKQRQFSTKLEDKGEAMELAIRAENGLRRQRETNQLIETLTRLAEETTGESSSDPIAWLDRWLTRRASEVAPATAAAYRTAITSLSGALQTRSIMTFQGITPDALLEIRDEWAANHSAVTANHKMKITRMALADAVREKMISENPAQTIRALKKSAKATRRAFTDLELRALIESADTEWQAVILMAVSYGPRLSDLCSLRWSNIDLDTKVIQFRTNKTDRPILLPIIPDIETVLEALPSADTPGAFVFPTLGGMNGPSVSNAFRRILVKAGLADKRTWRTGQSKTGKRKTSELSFHSLRYTANTYLKGAGIPDAIVMAIVGHETRAMSDHYTGFDAPTIRAAMERAELTSLLP